MAIGRDVVQARPKGTVSSVPKSPPYPSSRIFTTGEQWIRAKKKSLRNGTPAN